MCQACQMAYHDITKPFAVHSDSASVHRVKPWADASTTGHGQLRLVTCTSKKLNAVDNRITNETVKTDTDGNVPDYVNQPRYASALNQLASGQFAGVSACVSGTRAITLPAVYTSTPVILVFDETTAGGAKLIAKSATGFAVSCTGATDIFDWMVVGNPN